MRVDDKIARILEWANDKPFFDTEFVESLNEYYETHGELTEFQVDALDKIIRKFRINDED